MPAHPFGTKGIGKAIGSAVDLAVSQSVVTAYDGDRIGRVASALLEEMVDEPTALQLGHKVRCLPPSRDGQTFHLASRMVALYVRRRRLMKKQLHRTTSIERDAPT
jgi:hypothetical protein